MENSCFGFLLSLEAKQKIAENGSTRGVGDFSLHYAHWA
jgi:hypothetical protein